MFVNSSLGITSYLKEGGWIMGSAPFPPDEMLNRGSELPMAPAGPPEAGDQCLARQEPTPPTPAPRDLTDSDLVLEFLDFEGMPF